jgi:integrase
MPLTDAKIRSAKPRTKPYKLADERGLYLMITPAGARSWRYDYRLAGKRDTCTYGLYPDVSLAEAREKHAAAHKLVTKKLNPKDVEREKSQASATFGEFAEEWYASVQGGRSPRWREQNRRWLNKRLGRLGAQPILQLGANDYLRWLAELESEAPHVAAGIKKIISATLTFGVRKGRFTNEKVKEIAGTITLLTGAVRLPQTTHNTPLMVSDMGDFLHLLNAYGGSPITVTAAKLLLLTAVRKRELIEATWGEIDFDNAKWVIPAARMKGRKEHEVPLAPQVLELFKVMKAFRPQSAAKDFVFLQAGDPSVALSGGALNYAFRAAGIKAVPHGLRACFSTWANDQGSYRSDVIEACLAHREPNAVRGTYNNAKYRAERRKLMDDWAAYIEAVQGGNVIDLKQRAA